jgi:hypothetical protein
MDSFDFDSEKNIESTKTPSIKAISSGIKDKDKNIGAGLWIAHENADICKWRKNCKKSCSSDCTAHFVNCIPHNIDTRRLNEQEENIVINGCAIINPRMCIIQRSLLLKVINKTGKIIRAWRARESKVGENGEMDKYACVRKYLILFVDKDNNPLHEVPLQLTAKGCFQFEFDQQLNGGKGETGYVPGFRNTMIKSYNESQRKNSNTMSDSWHAMCVFVPTFSSQLRGKEKQMRACITTGFEKPTKDTWEKYCIGKRTDLANLYWKNLPEKWTDSNNKERSLTYAQHVFEMHKETKNVCERRGWWRKNEEQTSNQSPRTEVDADEEVGIGEY